MASDLHNAASQRAVEALAAKLRRRWVRHLFFPTMIMNNRFLQASSRVSWNCTRNRSCPAPSGLQGTLPKYTAASRDYRGRRAETCWGATKRCQCFLFLYIRYNLEESNPNVHQNTRSEIPFAKCCITSERNTTTHRRARSHPLPHFLSPNSCFRANRASISQRRRQNRLWFWKRTIQMISIRSRGLSSPSWWRRFKISWMSWTQSMITYRRAQKIISTQSESHSSIACYLLNALVFRSEIILTIGKSSTVEAFLKSAAHYHNYTVIVAESGPS